MILLSIVTNNKDAKPVIANSLDELQKIICTNTWAPALFKEGIRNNENFMSTQLLALDVDSGATIEDAAQVFHKYKFIIAPTRSHMKEKNGTVCHRFRIILFLSETITDKNDYLTTWKAAEKLLPEIDGAAKDPARQFFASQYIAEVSDGEDFPVIKGTKAVEAKVVKVQTEQKYPVPVFVTQFMTHGSNSWNQTLYKASKMLQEANYEEEDAIDLLSSMTCAQFSGTLDHADIKTIKSAFSTPGKYNPKVPWPVMIQTKSGNYIVDATNHTNLEYFLTSIYKKPIKRNLLRNTIEVGDELMDDYEFSKIKLSAMDHGLRTSSELLTNLIFKIADENQYHPFKDLIKANPWDKGDHIGQLYATIGIDGDELPIYKEYLKRWLIGVIARIYDNNGQQNNVLVLLGSQGAGKSRWLDRFSVAPSMYSEGMVDPHNKDDILKTVYNVIFHLSELDSITRKKDASALKQFLTAGSADVRAPYDRFSKRLTPVCSFVASVNDNKFLVDDTGNRRFLVLPIKSLNPDHKVNMVQVFSQALELFKDGEKFYFDREEIAKINTINDNYKSEDKFDYMTANLRAGDDEISGDELLDKLGYKDGRTVYDYTKLGKTLSEIGIKGKRKEKEGKRVTFYSVDKESLPKEH